jgi:hypothetical protein
MYPVALLPPPASVAPMMTVYLPAARVGKEKLQSHPDGGLAGTPDTPAPTDGMTPPVTVEVGGLGSTVPDTTKGLLTLVGFFGSLDRFGLVIARVGPLDTGSLLNSVDRSTIN